MDDNLNGALLAVKSAWEEVQLAFGDTGPQSSLTKGLKGLATVLRTVAANIELVTAAMVSMSLAFVGLKFAPFLAGLNSGTAVLALMTKGIRAASTAMTGLALNPVTIGFLALAAAVLAVTAAFDKYKKLQDELEAIELRTHKMRLAHVQAKVKEIQDRKAATKAVDGYITKLEQENRFMGFTAEKQREQIELHRAMGLAKRELGEEETKRLQAALKERDAIKATNETRKQEKELLTSITQPLKDYNHQVGLLDALMGRQDITATQYKDTLQKLKEQYGQLGEDAGTKYLAGLAEENRLMGLNNNEREEAIALAAARSSAGEDLGPEQVQAVKDLVAARQELKATGYLEGLAAENELLKMNSAERELQEAYSAAELAIGAPLDDAQKKTVANTLAENQALTDQAMLLEQIKGPQEEYNRLHGELGILLAADKINLEEYEAAVKQLAVTMAESTNESSKVVQDSWGTVWKGAGSALDEFAKGGIVTFKGLANSIIQDLQRIIQKQILMMAFKSMGIPIPGAATGASFKIGGSGGTDSKLAMFKATPGERVDVLTPGQQRTQAPAAQAPVINIINVSDPNEVPDGMASTEGEQVIINTLTKNRDTVRQAIA